MDPISFIIIELFGIVTIFILILLYAATINAEIDKKKDNENIDTMKKKETAPLNSIIPGGKRILIYYT